MHTHTDVHKFQTKLYFPTNLTFSSVNVYNIYCENNHGKTVQINYSYASKQQITYCVYFDMVYTHIRPRTLTGRYLTTPDPPFPGFVLISLYIFFIPFFFFSFLAGILVQYLLHRSFEFIQLRGHLRLKLLPLLVPRVLGLGLVFVLDQGQVLAKDHMVPLLQPVQQHPIYALRMDQDMAISHLGGMEMIKQRGENFSICQRGWENWVLTVICTITE